MAQTYPVVRAAGIKIADVGKYSIHVEAHLVVADAKAAAAAARKQLAGGKAKVPKQFASVYDSPRWPSTDQVDPSFLRARVLNQSG